MVRTIALYGQSNSTKSSQCYHLAKWYIERFRRKVRYVNADNGEGVKYVIDAGLEDAGWVDTLDITNQASGASATIMKLAEGYWPRVKGPFARDSQHAFHTSDNVGMYIFEGGTSIAELIKRGFSSSADKKGFANSYNYKEDDYNFGGVAMQHIGLIQDTVMRAIIASKRIPGLDFVIWTFHATKADEKLTKATLIGPEIIGNSVTPKIAKELGALIHLHREMVTVDRADGSSAEESRAVAYFTEHPDPSSGIPYTAKLTLLPELLGKWQQKYPEGKAVLSYEHGIAPMVEDMVRLQEMSRKVGERFVQSLNVGVVSGANRPLAGSTPVGPNGDSDSRGGYGADGGLVVVGTPETAIVDRGDRGEREKGLGNDSIADNPGSDNGVGDLFGDSVASPDVSGADGGVVGATANVGTGTAFADSIGDALSDLFD